jgi:hypothetical protein
MLIGGLEDLIGGLEYFIGGTEDLIRGLEDAGMQTCLGLHVSASEMCFAILEGQLPNQAMPIETVHLVTPKLQDTCTLPYRFIIA